MSAESHTWGGVGVVFHPSATVDTQPSSSTAALATTAAATASRAACAAAKGTAALATSASSVAALANSASSVAATLAADASGPASAAAPEAEQPVHCYSESFFSGVDLRDDAERPRAHIHLPHLHLHAPSAPAPTLHVAEGASNGTVASTTGDLGQAQGPRPTPVASSKVRTFSLDSLESLRQRSLRRALRRPRDLRNLAFILTGWGLNYLVFFLMQVSRRARRRALLLCTPLASLRSLFCWRTLSQAIFVSYGCTFAGDLDSSSGAVNAERTRTLSMLPPLEHTTHALPFKA